MARVELEHLKKVFRGLRGEAIPAVVDVSLAVETGELLVLVGPSASGKTTLLRLIAGLEEPDAGVIRIEGQVVNERGPKERDVAMVFQSPALYPHLTAFENMAFGLKLRGVSRGERQERVRWAAEMLGISACLGRRPMELSGGERQRVALGRAMVRRPKLILLDEPLSNLDAPLRAQMRLELARLQQRLGTTMVYVTHDQAEAMSLGNRLAVMRAGRIEQAGEPEEVYGKPASVSVAGFLGTPAMSFLRGRLMRRGAGMVFEVEGEPGIPGAASVAIEMGTAETACVPQGKGLILGLRAEDVEVQGSHDGDFSGEVELVERHGAEVFAHVRVGGRVVIGRAGGEVKASVGQTVGMRMDTGRAHWFEQETGRRIE